MLKSFIPAILLLSATISCSILNQPSSPSPRSPTPTQTASPTSKETIPVMADSFFYGKAYIDANQNGIIDPDDPPLEGALFIATDAVASPVTARPTPREVPWPGGPAIASTQSPCVCCHPRGAGIRSLARTKSCYWNGTFAANFSSNQRIPKDRYFYQRLNR